MFLLSEINIFETNLDSDDIINQEYQIMVVTKPRVPRPLFRQHKEKTRVIQQKWSRDISLFKDYLPDTPEILKKCFEKDWSEGKYMNFVKDDDDRDNLKEVLRGYYKNLRECYHHCSSFSNVVFL